MREIPESPGQGNEHFRVPAKRLTELRRYAKEHHEPPVPDPEFEQLSSTVKENWWKFHSLQDRVNLIAEKLGIEPQAVREAIAESITPEILVKANEQPLVESLNQQQFEMYCLLQILKEKGFDISVWTLGDEAWQREKFERSGASKYIDNEHLYVAEGEKISKLREIFDKIIQNNPRETVHVYVVDDNKNNLTQALGLAQEYEEKNIKIHDYQLKLQDSQADGTAFYKWIMSEREKNPNLILILDFDQVIADTDGALEQACEKLLDLQRKPKTADTYPWAA